MGHLNELQEKYGDTGLSVIAVTSEGSGSTDAWMKKHEAEYAYAYDKTGSVTSALGGRGLPSAALIDASGKLLWKGHPAGIQESMIEKAVEGAMTTALFEVEGYHRGISEALADGEFGKVVAQIEKLETEESRAVLRRVVGGMIDRRVVECEGLFEQGDYLAFQELAEPLAKTLKKLPQAERVEELLAGLKDRTVKKILRAQIFFFFFFQGA